MSPDLIDQLQAFGRTMEQSVGEPISAESPAVPAPEAEQRRRWLAPVAIAASIIVLVAGLTWFATQDRSTPATVPVAPTTLSPRPLIETVGDDPLGLAASGEWSLEERRVVPLLRSSTENCDGPQLADFNGRATIYERYSRTGPSGPELNVFFLDAGTPEGAARVLQLVDPQRECDPTFDALPLTTSESVGGFRLGDEFAVMAVRSSGNVVITFELENEGVTDDIINDLVDRGASWLAQHPAVASAEPVAADVLNFCVFSEELAGERPESYIGSSTHVDDIGVLIELAPADLRADLERYRDFVRDDVSPTEPDSQMTENWPAEIRTIIDRVTATIDERC